MKVNDFANVPGAIQNFDPNLRDTIECEILKACCKACNVSPRDFLLHEEEIPTDIHLWGAIAESESLIIGVLAPLGESFSAQLDWLREAEEKVIAKFREALPTAIVDEKLTIESLEASFPLFREALTVPPPPESGEDSEGAADPILPPNPVIMVAINPKPKPDQPPADDEQALPIAPTQEDKEEFEKQKLQALLDGIAVVDADTLICTNSPPVGDVPCEVRPAPRGLTPCLGPYEIVDARGVSGSTPWPVVEVIFHAHPFAMMISDPELVARMDTLAGLSAPSPPQQEE